MKKRYIIPATTFLAGLLIWIVLFVIFTAIEPQLPLWIQLLIGMLPGGLILFSGIRCKLAGGPRIGNIIRASVLVVLSLFTWWKIDVIAAGILLAAAVVLGLMAKIERPT